MPLNNDAQQALSSMAFIAMERKASYSRSLKSAKKIASRAAYVDMSVKQALQFFNRHREARNEWLKSTDWTEKDCVLMVDPPKRVRGDTLGDIFADIRATTPYKGTDVVLYDARHSFAVNCLDDGRPITKLALILGHSGIKLTQRYARTDRLTVPDFNKSSGKQGTQIVDPDDKLTIPDRSQKKKNSLFG